MSKILTAITFLGFLSALLSCNKDEKTISKSKEELLTQKEWTLASVGFDDNKNGLVDANEELIKECERDNSLRFNLDGTASFVDNGLQCGGPQNGTFNWVLTNNKSELLVDGNRARILQLDDRELRYTPVLEELTASFIIVYRHP